MFRSLAFAILVARGFAQYPSANNMDGVSTSTPMAASSWASSASWASTSASSAAGVPAALATVSPVTTPTTTGVAANLAVHTVSTLSGVLASYHHNKTNSDPGDRWRSKSSSLYSELLERRQEWRQHRVPLHDGESHRNSIYF